MKARSPHRADNLSDWLALRRGLSAGIVAQLAQVHQQWAESLRVSTDEQALAVRTLDVLRELKVDDETLLAAALYPEARAHPEAIPELTRRFGAAQDTLLQGQLEADKVWPLHEHKAANASAEGLRRLLLVLIRDLRVVFILLARQLVRLRHAADLPEPERRRLAQLAGLDLNQSRIGSEKPRLFR